MKNKKIKSIKTIKTIKTNKSNTNISLVRTEKIFFAILLLSLAASPTLLAGEAVIVPGSVERLCNYSNYFYNFPNDDFIYYLNDRLLFSEPPDGKIAKNRLRMSLLGVVINFEIIRNHIANMEKDEQQRVILSLEDPRQYLQAVELLKLLSRGLKKESNDKYSLKRLKVTTGADYPTFTGTHTATMVQQMNLTKTLFFRLKESKINVPWDFAFLKEVTGLNITSRNFLAAMLKEERFSLLLAVLYRLSDAEIKYIGSLDPIEPNGAWKKIYRHKTWLMGMYTLAHALRVSPGISPGENRLLLPGGEAAGAFWTKLATPPPSTETSTASTTSNEATKGETSKTASTPASTPSPVTEAKPGTLEFLRQLAIKDGGKLNYLYTFSYFLEEEKRKVLFLDYDADAFKEVYDLIPLTKKETLDPNRLPSLTDWNFFTLLYTLRVKDGAVDFPRGLDVWLKLAGKAEAAPVNGAQAATLKDFYLQLLDGFDATDKLNKFQVFMAVYSKFINRPELLKDGGLERLYSSFKQYNGLVDVIEKIPLKKSATVTKIMDWAPSLEALSGRDEQLYIALYQSLFEILAFMGKHAPGAYDYDQLVSELLELPLEKAKFYPATIEWFKKRFRVRERGRSLAQVMLSGIKNQRLKLDGATYRYMANRLLINKIDEILQSQEGWPFATFLEIQRLLKAGLKAKPPYTGDQCRAIQQVFRSLPHPGISKKAPKAIRQRVAAYSPAKLTKLIKELTTKIGTGSPASEQKALVDEINGDYLIYQLRDHLMILTYAINAKSDKLKVFMNPNFVRLHDFELRKGKTFWDNNGVDKKGSNFSKYHLDGVMSRLNITMSPKWKAQLFRDNIIHNYPHVQAMFVNLINLYPLPVVKSIPTLYGLQVELGLDILSQCREDEEVANQLRKILGSVTTGYHYRRTMEYVDSKSEEHNLFFAELRKVGEAWWKSGHQLEFFDNAAELKKFSQPLLAKSIEQEKIRFGGIHFHTFGNLKPQHFDLFPQEMANFFDSGWLSGSMVEEFKVKFAHHMYKKKIPAALMGQMLFMYLTEYGARFLRQSHANDFYITYFIFDVFNNGHRKKQIKTLQKQGFLKLN